MEGKPLTQSPQQLVRRLDRLYTTLATVYLRIGRALGVEAKAGSRRSLKRYSRLTKRRAAILKTHDKPEIE